MTSTDTPTTHGMRDGFNYDTHPFTADFPVPADYVIAFGMAHFRGPDGQLWYAPSYGASEPDADGWAVPAPIDWAAAQNVAEYERRTGENNSRGEVAAMRDLCRALDAVRRASARYVQAGRVAAS